MVINFFGRRGCGKTTVIKGQLKDCRGPIIIIDVLGNYTQIPNSIQVEDLKNCILEIKKYHLSEKAGKQPPQKIINLKTSQPTLAADYISACIWEINGGTMICDEIDSIHMAEGSCFDEYIRYGRNHNGDLLTGCRRPAELDRNITAAANKFYCFNTHEYRDIEYFSTVFGDRSEELLKMPAHTGLYLDYDRQEIGKFKVDASGLIYHTETNSV